MTAVTQSALTELPVPAASAPGGTPVYDRIGVGYSSVRRPDPRWAQAIRAALGDARTVLNVGAGSGAYEPTDVRVVALEPSLEMRVQRAANAAPCVVGRAEHLPFDDQAFDAVQAVLTVHHWSDLEGGVSELLRVASRFAVVTYDMDVQAGFWFTRDYVPEIAEAERSRVPSLQRITELLGPCEVTELPVWHDFTDGFMTAFWRRPEAYLDPMMRRACSAFALTDQAAVERGVARLRDDLASGAWHRRYADLVTRDRIDAGFRLLTGTSPHADGTRRTTTGEGAAG